MSTFHDHTVRRIRETYAALLCLETINIPLILDPYSLLFSTWVYFLGSFEKVKQAFESRSALSLRCASHCEIKPNRITSQFIVCSRLRLSLLDIGFTLIYITLAYFELHCAIFNWLRNRYRFYAEVSQILGIIVACCFFKPLCCPHDIVIRSGHQNPSWNGSLMFIMNTWSCFSLRVDLLSISFSNTLLSFSLFWLLTLPEISIGYASLYEAHLTMNFGVKYRFSRILGIS